MNKKYREMMLQQSLSEEAEAAFYEKLEQEQTRKRRSPVLRAATIAACALLLIPVTILAMENIFGVVRVDRVDQVTVHDRPGVGLDIRFENVENRPITDFSRHLQTLDQSTVAQFDSWEEAEKDLGIDLLSNTLCTDGKTAKAACFGENGARKSCEGRYLGREGQLYYAKIGAAYCREQVTFVVSATVTAQHPTVPDGQLRNYHGTSIAYYQENDPHVKTERYTTQNGIPMTICTVDLGNMAEYMAYFAVDDVSYGVQIVGCEGVWDDASLYGMLCQILEGFVI